MKSKLESLSEKGPCDVVGVSVGDAVSADGGAAVDSGSRVAPADMGGGTASTSLVDVVAPTGAEGDTGATIIGEGHCGVVARVLRLQ